jgi:hypothetical protein
VVIFWLSIATTCLIFINGAVVGTLAMKYQTKPIIVLVAAFSNFYSCRYPIDKQGNLTEMEGSLLLTSSLR